MARTRRTIWAVTTSRTLVPLAAARRQARATASAPEWSHEIVAVMSAISAVAPRLMMASSCSRISPELDTSICSGSVTTARRPCHLTG